MFINATVSTCVLLVHLTILYTLKNVETLVFLLFPVNRQLPFRRTGAEVLAVF